MQERKHGERQLQRQHHLAEGQQIGDAAVAAQANNENRRQNGQRASDEPPHPRFDPPVHEAFHHHLPGQRAGDGAALAAGQQSHRKQRARSSRPQQRRQRQIRDPNPIAVGAELDHLAARDGHAFLAKEHHRRQHQDGGIDEESDGQRDDRVDGVESDRAPHGRFVLLQLAALHQSRVQIQIVRHHRRADDADGHVQHSRLAKVGEINARPISRKLGWVCGSTKISMK